MDDRLLADPEDPYPEGVDGPTVDIPHVDVPRAPVDTLTDSPIIRTFILQVLLWNAILLVASLGVFLIVFRSNWTTGSQLLGVAAVLVLYSRYRWPNRGSDDE